MGSETVPIWSLVRRVWIIAMLMAGLVVLSAGCGQDNPGEPRSPAARLSAPNLGDVHVYCVEQANVTPTTCSVSLDANGSPTRTQLQAWWLRAARALRKAGTFRYEGASWRFDYVTVTRPVAQGHLIFGWRCASDAGKSPQLINHAMDARTPGYRRGIYTLADARRKQCTFEEYPDPFNIYAN
jgi:hypothetical protein